MIKREKAYAVGFANKETGELHIFAPAQDATRYTIFSSKEDAKNFLVGLKGTWGQDLVVAEVLIESENQEVEMTHEEIEKKLGRKIRIVSEKK